MRSGLLAEGLVVASALTVLLVAEQDLVLPRIGPRVEDVCVQAMKRSPSDRSWVVEGYQGRDVQDVQPGELMSHHGDLVRVTGVLHAEYEWIALYPSRAAMEDAPSRWPWVDLTSLDLRESAWPSITDRCVVLEGRYRSGAAGHFLMFNGRIDVRRLDVWSMPHRPYVTAPRPPPPPPAPVVPCAEKVRRPEPVADSRPARELAEAFARLYETGEFRQGLCVAEARVREDGVVDSIRMRPSKDLDPRVEAAVVRSLTVRRYKPAVACGRPVAFSLTFSVLHCPSLASR